LQWDFRSLAGQIRRRPPKALDVTNQIQRQVTAAIQLRGNFAVAMTDRV
jgi:hypothetical protein